MMIGFKEEINFTTFFGFRDSKRPDFWKIILSCTLETELNEV